MSKTSMILTPSQIDAIRASDKSVVVTAPAGSGKTSVLTEHYRHLTVEKGIPPYRILAFTFTEKAAGEIKERIVRDKIIRPDEEVYAFIGTMHAFYSRLLRRHGHRMGLDPEFVIINETEVALRQASRIKEALLRDLTNGLPLITGLVKRLGFLRLCRIMQSLLGEIHPHKAKPSGSADLAEGLSCYALKFFNDCIAEKKASSELDFDALEFLVVDLLERHQDIRQALCKRYKHILVDEFQDTNALQGHFISMLHNPETNCLFIVGDLNQSIYRFRHADVSVFKKVAEQIGREDGKITRLGETFRIPPNLTSAINRVFTALFGENGSASFFQPMKSLCRGELDSLHIVVSPRGEDNSSYTLRRGEARWIAQKISSLNLKPSEMAETALLFRTSTPMYIYREELVRAGLPCSVAKTEPLLKKACIRDLLHILAYLAGDTSAIAQTGILRSVFFNFSEYFIEHIAGMALPHFPAPHTPHLFESAEDRACWNRLTALFSRWTVLKKIFAPHPLLEIVLSDLGFLHGGAKGVFCRPAKDVASHLEQFLHIVGEIGRREKISIENLHKILASAAENENREITCLDSKRLAGAIRLMTIHSAKGLEFKRVFLPQLYGSEKNDSPEVFADPDLGIAVKEEEDSGNGGIKIRLKEGELFKQLKERNALKKLDESKRLLYVAMTRVKEELYLFLREPAKTKIDLKTSKSWNDWLWLLLKEERQNAVILPSAKESV